MDVSKVTRALPWLNGGDEDPPVSSRLVNILSHPVSLTWENALVGLLLVAVLLTRLWSLGARVMSHDESLHVYFSWQLASGRGYTHNPMMHGPFLFESTALVNLLFGANDFTSRLVPVLLGTFAAVFIPRLLKPWLGGFGALAASFFFLISPYVMYFSRYIRHDMLVIAWALLAIVAMFRYLQNRRTPDLALLAAALALMFSTMEITFFYLAILAGFLVLRLISVFFRARGLAGLRKAAELDLLVVIATLGAFFSSPVALLLLNPFWQKTRGAPFVDLQVFADQNFGWSAKPEGLRLWVLLGVFSLAAVAIGLWWDRKRWPKLAVIFLLIAGTLFTTFWINPAGLGTGFVGSLGYWLSQHDVTRGGQPWYYYLIVFPLYEYLPILGGLAASGYFLLRRRQLPAEDRLFVPFLALWAVGIFSGLSLAGEKMPWLSTHIAIPFILLTGWFAGKLLGGHVGPATRLNLAAAGRALALAGLLVLSVLTFRGALVSSYVNYDYTTEYIDYAHGAPGVKWVMEDLQAIANHTGAGKSLKVAYDDQVSWPFSWYLRDIPNQSFFGDQPNRQALDAPVVIAGSKNWQKVESLLGSRYHRFEVIRMWWPLEDYKNLTWERIRSALANPEMRGALADIFWRRDYTRYAALTGQELDPPAKWPLADRMRIYVQKEIAAQMLGLSLGGAILEEGSEAADAYEKVRIQPLPEKTTSAGFSQQRNLAFSPDGSIWVADSGNSRLIRLDPDGKLLMTLGSRTPEGQTPSAPGTFNEPWGLAVDGQGNLYVADTWNGRIQKFDSQGEFLQEWGQAEALWGPRGIAVSPEGRVYVTDTGNKRVLVYDLQGRLLFEFGKEGEGRLDEPVGIALGPDGSVFVADAWNGRVAVFSAEGEYKQSWQVQAWYSASIGNKPYIAVDAQGRVYITDPEGYQVIVFSASGEALAAFGQYGPEEDDFGLPIGIAVSPDGIVWIADAGNDRLVAYPTIKP